MDFSSINKKQSKNVCHHGVYTVVEETDNKQVSKYAAYKMMPSSMDQNESRKRALGVLAGYNFKIQ